MDITKYLFIFALIYNHTVILYGHILDNSDKYGEAVHSAYKELFNPFSEQILDVEGFVLRPFSSKFLLSLQMSDDENEKLVLRKLKGLDLQRAETYLILADTEKCKQLKSFSADNLLLVFVFDCENNSSSSFFYVINNNLSFTKYQLNTFENISDLYLWKNNILNKIYLVTIPSKNENCINYYKYDEIKHDFMKFGCLSTHGSKPHTLIVFNIDSSIFIAFSIYLNEIGTLTSMQIYLQNNIDGQLQKYQRIRILGKCLSISHACYIGDIFRDDFLLVTSLPEINTLFSDYNSTVTRLYKFDDGYFMPFQNLWVPFSSKLITTEGDPLLVITLSDVEGIVSYQYDGWRFSRTTSYKMSVDNINRHKTLKAFLINEPVELLSVTSSYKEKMKFLQPEFENNVVAYNKFQESLIWCENSYLEINLFKKKHYKLFQIPGKCHGNCEISHENLIYLFFHQVFGRNHMPFYNVAERPVDIVHSRKVDNNNSITHKELVIFKHAKSTIKNNYEDSCTLEISFLLHDIEHLVPLEVGLVSLQSKGSIVIYPTLESSYNLLNGKEVFKLKYKGVIFTQFSYLRLCTSDGLYIEGLFNGNMFSHIYSLSLDDMALFKKLKLNERSYVHGICINETTQCFLITNKKGTKCEIQCSKDSTKFNCDSVSIQDTIDWNYFLKTMDSKKEFDIQKIFLKSKLKSELKEEMNSTLHQKYLVSLYLNNTLYRVVSRKNSIYICGFDNNNMKETTQCQEIEKGVPNSRHFKLSSLNNELLLFIGNNYEIKMYFRKNNVYKKHIIWKDNKYNYFIPFNTHNKSQIAIVNSTDAILGNIICF